MSLQLLLLVTKQRFLGGGGTFVLIEYLLGVGLRETNRLLAVLLAHLQLGLELLHAYSRYIYVNGGYKGGGNIYIYNHASNE